MTNKISIALVALTISLSTNAVTIDTAAEQRAADIVSRMTLDEKLAYIGGYHGFNIRPVERLGLPKIRMADGPQGVRNDTHSTLYPCGIAAASTWNRDMLSRYGRSLARDARARGVHIILGPGVNIYRSPLCGRNYEYYGEDPYLTSQIAGAYIEGLQENGVMATVKHFCGNNQEWSRHNASSDIDERTLHEIYLPAFRHAVQKAGTGAVMSSYNPVNGVHTTENKELVQDVLRDLWGFKGIYMSDWTATYSTIGAANNGLDLEMSWGQFMNPEKLRQAIANGTVTEETIDTKCRHILQTLIAFGFLDNDQLDKTIPERDPQSTETALDIAREAVVLLKNDGILPLSRKVRKVIVAGPNATSTPTGGGSGLVTPFETVSVARGIASVDKKIKTTVLTPELSVDLTATGRFLTPDGKPGLHGEFYANKDLKGEPVASADTTAIDFFWQGIPAPGVPANNFSARWTGTFTPDVTGKMIFRIAGDDGYRLFVDNKEIMGDWWDHFITIHTREIEVEAGRNYDIRLEYYNALTTGTLSMSVTTVPAQPLHSDSDISKADAVVYCAGFDSSREGENCDRPFSLPREQLEEISRLADLNPNLIVLVNAGGGIDFMPFIDKARAILMTWYTGEQGGRAVADILTGRVNPSGRLPITIERRAEDNPTFNSYHTNVPTIYKSPERISYDEGVFVGYRGYDRNGTEPLFPFGFGLSYTTFEYTGLDVSAEADGSAKVTFTVRNTGSRDGAEVAQVYVSDPEASVPRPPKELKGFEKVTLRPGESRQIEIALPREAFEYYDMNKHCFVLEPGQIDIMVGSSSRDIHLQKSLIHK